MIIGIFYILLMKYVSQVPYCFLIQETMKPIIKMTVFLRLTKMVGEMSIT